MPGTSEGSSGISLKRMAVTAAPFSEDISMRRRLLPSVVPQLNLMAVGFPILVALGLIMMSVNLDLLGALMGGEIRNLESLLVTLLRSLGHGR